jgi:hypothetical protein
MLAIQPAATAPVRRTIGHTSWCARRPIASPTRIAPAELSPNAGMKAMELICMTTLNAARTVVPSFATGTLMKSTNAANSRNQLTPFGSPKRSTRLNSARRSPSLPAPRL